MDTQGIRPELLAVADVPVRHVTWTWRYGADGAPRLCVHLWGEFDVIRHHVVTASTTVQLWRSAMALGIIPAGTEYATFYRVRQGGRAVDGGAAVGRAYPSMLASHGMGTEQLASSVHSRLTRQQESTRQQDAAA